MLGSIVIILFFVAIYVLYRSQFQVRDPRDAAVERAWGEDARRLGLERIGPRALEGRLDGLRVSAYTQPVARGRNPKQVTGAETHLTIEGLRTKDVELRASGFFDGLRDDVVVGEAQFDRSTLVHGTPIVVRALIDDGSPDAWAVFTRAIAAGWHFSHGAWRLTKDDLVGEEILPLLEPGLAVARRFQAAERELPARLLRLFLDAREGTLAVRLAAFAHLRERYPRAPETREALERARVDTSPEVRLTVAVAVDDRVALKALTLDPSVPGPVRMEALAPLTTADHLGDLGAGLVADACAVWDSSPPGLKAALLALAAKHRLPGAVELARAALAVVAGPEAEPEEVKVAAVRLLGVLGQIEDVPALIPYREGVLPTELKHAANEAILAIQAIQERAGGAGAGALALAEDGGALALAEADHAVAHEPG